ACPHCGGFQQYKQDNMVFDHCKNLIGEWDFSRLGETYFKCVHCQQPIEEKFKRQLNDRTRRRWRRTNLTAPLEHISFQISDFYSYLVTWGSLAQEYIQSKGDVLARQGYCNHHQGLPYEVRET